MASRMAWARSLISLAKRKRIVVVSCDESPHYFGGSKHLGLTYLEGEDRHAYTGPKRRAAFTLQQWSACSSDTSILRRIKIWEPETDELKAELQEKLKKKQRMVDEKVEYQRHRAAIQGTWEHRIMLEVNYEINTYNRGKPKKNRKHQKNLEQVFKYKKLERENEKGGMDFVFYAFEILEKELLPYYCQIRDRNPDATVLLAEDNLGSHGKARELLADEIYAMNIQFLEQPANSPDLHPIERIFDNQKRLLSDYKHRVKSQSKASKEHAKTELKRTWILDKKLDNKVSAKMAVDNWFFLAQQCLKAGGDNKFNA